MIKANSNSLEKPANSFVCIEEPICNTKLLKRQNHLDSLDYPDSEDSSRIFLKVPTLTVGEYSSDTLYKNDPLVQKSDEIYLKRQKSLNLNTNSLKRNKTISGIHSTKTVKKPKASANDLNQSFNLLNVKNFDSAFHMFNPLDSFRVNKTPKDNDDGTQSEQSLSEYIGGGAPGYRHPRLSASMYLKEQICSLFQPGDNKLAMKLFGTQSALLKEKSRQKKHGHWIIHPCSSFRFYWDLLMLMVLVANLIVLPVAISFFNDDLSKRWLVFNGVSDTIFLLDIGVNFRTGIILNDFADEIILNPKQIAKHYARSWFIIDFLSSIPVDYIFLILNNTNHFSQFMHAGRALRILRLAKLLSLLRLLRLSRLVRYISQWEEFFNTASKFIGIFNLVLMMLLLGHWNACLQFLIPMMREFPNDCWIVKCNLKESLFEANWFDQYTWSLFKAMSHMLSIGYGRFPPTSTSEAWVTIVSMMTGATCYALFVGHAAALIQSYDTSKRLYREKYKQVEEYMGYRKLPRLLRQKITDYYEHRYQGNMFNEIDILQELSECLREKVINYNCRGLVASVPFFKNADDNFVSEVVVKLHYEVFQPGDFIIKEGTVGSRMYFIQEGIVDIITKDGEIATSLSDGSYFGEICLLADTRRVASVRAVTYCNVYSLDRESFLSVLEHYPIMRRTMESVAAERLNKIGQNPLIVSDRFDLKEDLRIVNEFVNEAASTHSSDENKSITSKGSSKKPFKIQQLWNLRKTTLEAGLLWKSKVVKNDQNTQKTE